MSLDVQILTALRAAGDGAVSGAELSQKLRVSRAAIWARIDDLRSLGYDIEASPHRGYRLVSAPDVLHADDLISRLGKTKVIGRDIRVFQETTSTNDVSASRAVGRRGGLRRVADPRQGTAGTKMVITHQTRAVVFSPAAARLAPAGDHPANSGLGDGAAARHCIADWSTAGD
jgi:biotin operon repressor BirA-like protein